MSTLFDMAAGMVRADMNRYQRTHELETALNRMVLTYENTLSESDGRFPLKDSGCPDCTSGTVPDRLNTGPCAFHTAKRLLGQL